MGNEFTVGTHSELDGMKKYAGFSPGQVEIIREKFDLMADEDLTIGKEQFSKLMKVSEAETDRIFEFFDIDQSGRIDTYEFICALALLSQANLRQKIELVFNLYDFDKNRQITQNELVILIKTTLTALNAMASKPEATISDAEAKCKDMLSKYDTNKDGSISLKEFQSMITKDTEILKILFAYGLISKEDIRPDFGGGQDEMPECDSDLENEMLKGEFDRDDRIERIKNGIEHTELTPEEKLLLDNPDQKKEEEPPAKWMQNVKNYQPSDYKPFKTEQLAPCAHLDIDFVHGIRCFDTRNNLAYTASGQLIYHTAAIGIVYDTKANTQQFHLDHNDDITCMDSNGTTVVTGQLGSNPLICVWDVLTMQSKLVFKGVLKNGVSNVCLSNSCKIMAAVGFDTDHSIVIYDIDKAYQAKLNPSKKQEDYMIATGKLAEVPVWDLRFEPNDKFIVAACARQFIIVTFENGQIRKQLGIWEKNSPPQSVLCIGFMETNIVTGMFRGQLCVWKNNRLTQTNPAHSGPVTAICTRKGPGGGVITGGKDGYINIWDKNCKNTQKIDMKELRFYSSKIIAVAEHTESGSIAVATRSSEIAEIMPNKRILIKGHWEGELWGLCINPKAPQYFTVGEDNFLACWDIKQRRLLQGVKLDFPAKALHMSSNGKYLAVGCLNGSVLIVDPKSLVVTFTFKERDKEVSCIKFSPDNEQLAVAYGAPSCEVLIYNVKEHFKNEFKIRGSTSRVTHMDFSKDCKSLQVCNQRFEMLFFDLKTGKQHKADAQKELREEKWATYTCIFGWSVQGIWPPCSNGLDINSVDRSSTRADVIVSGDDFSKLKLFKFPCVKPNASFCKYSGHSSFVTNVRFSMDDEYIISTGGMEKSIIQWRYTFDAVAQSEIDEIHLRAGDDEKDDEMFEEEKNEKGEEQQGVKPYQSAAMQSQPQQHKPNPKKDNTNFNGNLTLQYVHGFRCQFMKDDCREMCKYLNTGKIVFGAAAVGVVMDTKSKSQNFFIKHRDDIISLAVHPKQSVVATGCGSVKGENKLVDILIWEAESKAIIGHINDFHRRGVNFLSFSPDGSLLLSAGLDEDFSIAIHDWQGARIVANTKVDRAKITSMCWKSQTEFMSCGMKHVKFYALNGRNLKIINGTLGKKFEAQTCSVSAFNGSVWCTGSVEGNIYVWPGVVQQPIQPKIVKAHEGKVGSLISIKGTNMLSGGQDGKVIMWQYVQGLSKQADLFELAKLDKIAKYDTSIVSLDIKNDMVLIGTRGAEIYEGKQGALPQQILIGHYDGELWGLAINQKNKQFVTSGGDKTIRLWDMDTKKMLMGSKPFDCDMRAIDWSQNGELIAAGDVKGNILLIDPKTLMAIDSKGSKSTQSGKKAQFWIEDLKISPDNTRIAFGTHGSNSQQIEIWDIVEGKLSAKSIPITAGITGALTHLDWSNESNYLIINSSAYELKFVNVTQKKENTASVSRDIEWSTMTCVYSWFTQGIFQGAEGLNVNTCCRSMNKLNYSLVTGDDFGKINLFRFPVVTKQQVHKEYLGHSSRITRVKFAPDDTMMISIGGNDRCIFMWETDFGANQKLDEQLEEEVKQPQQLDEAEDETLKGLQEKKRKLGKEKFGISNKKDQKKDIGDGGDIFGEEDAGKGEEFLAVKPWLGALKEPSNYYKDALNQSKKPPITLNLEYVFGYRAKDCRNNIKYLKQGSIVFHAAALGIVMDPVSNTQKFFNLHQDDITCLDVHPEGVKVATGEIGAKPSIFVWDSTTLLPICQFKGILTKGIASLAFNPSGDKLAAVAIDPQHQVAIFDITAKSKLGGLMICKENGGVEQIFEISWRTDSEFATGGLRHFSVWNFQNSNLKSKNAQRGKNKCSDKVMTVTSMGEDYLVGAFDGTLQVFKGNQLNTFKKLHEKPMDCIAAVNGQYILTGGRDAKINILDKSYNPLIKVTEENIKQSLKLEIRAVWLSTDCKSMIVGTLGGEIYELTTKDAKINPTTKFSNPKTLMKAHFAPNLKTSNEVWGLATFPNDPDAFVTCGDDATLRVWSIQQRKLLKQVGKTNLSNQPNAELDMDTKTGDLSDQSRGRSIAVTNDGENIIVGFKDGTIKVFDKELGQRNFIPKCAKDWISDIKLNNDNSVVAFGSHDNAIYVNTFPEFKQKVKPMRKHASFITHLDFNRDGNALHSNCGGYELLFWDVMTGKQLTNGPTQFRDEHWQTWTSTLGWPVQGIWPECSDGSDINSCDRSHLTYSGHDNPPDCYYLLATGDDFSKIKIYRYPCIKRGSEFVLGSGHSSHITNVRFSNDDSYLFTTGGEDCCVFLWKVNKIK